MKKIILATIAATVLVSVFAFKIIQHYADILKELQMNPAEAKESIYYNFQDGVLNIPYSKIITRLAVGKREAVVKELGDYIKAYTESAEFAAIYKEAREAAKPQGAPSAEEKIKTRIEQIKQDIQETETDLPKQTGNMKKMYEAQLLELKKELKALSNPSDPAHAWYAQNVTDKKDRFGENMAAEDLKSWQEDYPPTVKELVKKRLTEFLDVTNDIDFNAKLVQRGSKMFFADPALEAKSSEWKKCFRCGKETITAARRYAQQWLASLK